MSKEILVRKISKSVSELALYNSKLCLEFTNGAENECQKEVVQTLAHGIFDMLDVIRRHDAEFDAYFLKETGCSAEAIEEQISDVLEKMHEEE